MNNAAVNAVVSVDRTFLFIFGASAIMLVLITLAMIYFVIRYSRKRHPVAATFDHNLIAEVIWIVLPTLLVMAMFYYGWQSFRALREAPDNAMEVQVTARMWSWSFKYPNGKQSPELYVPVGSPVKLALTSVDVIHGFFLPAFRVKIDTVPGMITHAWFRADQPGTYDIFCSVYCGLRHADMLSKVRAVEPAEFDAWLNGQAASAAPGRDALDRHGCLGCHSLDGSELAGPSLKDIKGRQVTLVDAQGRETKVVVDEAYLRQAILGEKPGGVVKGYDSPMPSFKGQIDQADQQAILDFLLERQGPPPLEGGKVADEQGCLGCHSTDGSILSGPSFKGLLGSLSTVIENGKERMIKVDEQYVLDMLADPSKHQVKGYDPIMPAYPSLSAAEKAALLRYLYELSGQPEASHEDHQGHEGHQDQAAPMNMPGQAGQAGHQEQTH